MTIKHEVVHRQRAKLHCPGHRSHRIHIPRPEGREFDSLPASGPQGGTGVPHMTTSCLSVRRPLSDSVVLKEKNENVSHIQIPVPAPTSNQPPQQMHMC